MTYLEMSGRRRDGRSAGTGMQESERDGSKSLWRKHGKEGTEWEKLFH